ncbi:MAG: response regulator [Prolixibacteraceae bacterium]|nr:response regulator [Prolixibacteraceae bacterium]
MNKRKGPVQRYNISVLFVDDNEIIRQLYKKFLAKHVENLFIAKDGHHGLELYEKHKPDLVITDMVMPVMNGLEMVKEIKKIAQDAKIIVMSAYSDKDSFIEAIHLGIDGYLMKPVEAKKLLSLIDEFAGITLMKWELERKEKKRQEAENYLKKSLEEKDILLREVHHRVKNNMQIISIILRMQGRIIDDQKLKDILQESQNRIHSMALIHENLYNNKNLADIKFSSYIKSLSGNIARTYASQQANVKFDYQIDDAYLPMDVAIPCGLIINELISNAFKYAFVDKANGTICIRFKLIEEGEFLLTVCDDGIGIPTEIDITKTKSLGMKIIHKLVQQIEGELQSDFSNGTKFTIKFKLSN